MSTWERELREGDFSSGMLVYSLSNGIVDRVELESVAKNPSGESIQQIVDKICKEGVVQRFLRRGGRKYLDFESLASTLGTVDIRPSIRGMKDVLKYHLVIKGFR